MTQFAIISPKMTALVLLLSQILYQCHSMPVYCICLHACSFCPPFWSKELEDIFANTHVYLHVYIFATAFVAAMLNAVIDLGYFQS